MKHTTGTMFEEVKKVQKKKRYKEVITNHGKIEIINKQSIVHKYKHTSSRNDRRKKMLLLLARVDLTEKCPVLSRFNFFD